MLLVHFTSARAGATHTSRCEDYPAVRTWHAATTGIRREDGRQLVRGGLRLVNGVAGMRDTYEFCASRSASVILARCIPSNWACGMMRMATDSDL